MIGSLYTKVRNDTRSFRRLLPYRISTSLIRTRARLTWYRRRNATIVAVTGSSGKSTAVALIGHILSAHAATKIAPVDNVPRPVARAFASITPDTRYAVFETAIGGNEDMKHVARMLKPDVALVTMVALEHRSTFKSVDRIIAEKSKLIKQVRQGGTVVVNADNEGAMKMVEDSPARRVTFGVGAGVDYRLLSVEQTAKPSLIVTMEFCGQAETFELPLIGTHIGPTLAGAIATAHTLGVPVETIRQQAACFAGVRGRLEVFRTERGPTFVLDTIKAPYHSIISVIENFGKVPAKRRIVIVGNISDYAGNPKSKYRKAREAALAAGDVAIFVGRTHRRCGAKPEEIAAGRFYGFDTVSEADAFLKQNARDTDLILLKSARSVHLERLALSWRTGVLCWLEGCGVGISCRRCMNYLPIRGNENE
ncbi:MAG: Mur ligase family protein [Pseudomonadota bacterium]